MLLSVCTGQGEKVAENKEGASHLHIQKGISEEELDCTGQAAAKGGESFAWRSSPK